MGLTILKDADKDSEQAEKTFGIIERQTDQLSRLVDDLLDVTRITQNKIVLKKERIDLNDVVYHIVTDFQPYFSEKGVRLDFELDPDSVYIDGDPARLVQAIDNLLHNAAKFTEKGDRVKVSVYLDKENKEQVFIVVQDTGVGIDPLIQERLFEPFVQADYSLAHSLGGLGLGLTIVKGMVELHGGSVSVFSEGIGKGTQFIIALPLPKDSDSGESLTKTEEEERQSHSLRILIIEDIPDLADIMSELLFHLGHEVIVALNGPDGIKKAKTYHPDVLISDIGLPEMNGYEIAEAIQNDEQLKNIYLMALSGYAQPEDIERSRKAGFRNHLAKPVNLENLTAALYEAYSCISK
jgi:CheY-like chemotaxis protein/two-component sensor histidine kinase